MSCKLAAAGGRLSDQRRNVLPLCAFRLEDWWRVGPQGGSTGRAARTLSGQPLSGSCCCTPSEVMEGWLPVRLLLSYTRHPPAENIDLCSEQRSPDSPWCIDGQRERERERDREREKRRQTDRQIDRREEGETERETRVTHIYMYIYIYIYIYV